ncbi:hypothetical protein G7Y79_00005g017760 [Physcia stellaris]|nr:hypothetical protein G7Y79_00005g017760 [Physcia stellaris]
MHPKPFSILYLLSLLTLLTKSISAVSSPPIRPLSTEENPFRTINVLLPNGESLPVLQSIKIPNFGIASIWSLASWAHGPKRPTWLRPVDPVSVSLLFDLTIAKYASRTSDEVAGYGTIGPEISSSLANLDTRVTVKQWEPGKNKTRFWMPSAGMKNKEIAYAAQRIKELYYTPGQSEHPQEAGWVLMNLTPPDEKGLRNIDNFTGVIMVQRDLWYPTYLDL